MNTIYLRIIVSFLALGVAAAHLIWPVIKIDSITVALLVIAVVPWLAPILKSVEVPGLKIELRDFQKASSALLDSSPPPAISAPLSGASASKSKAKAKLTLTGKAEIGIDARVLTKSEKAVANLRKVADSDQNLALVGFRIEIETRLRELAKDRGIEDHRSISTILRELRVREILPDQTITALADLITWGNKAAHGQHVDPDIGPWIFDKGGEMLASLDKFLAR